MKNKTLHPNGKVMATITKFFTPEILKFNNKIVCEFRIYFPTFYSVFKHIFTTKFCILLFF